ncbi:MAG: GNAT family N-acetyltransferase [Caldilineaceae bacterium]
MNRITIRKAVAADASRVAHIYIDSWNMGFGELMPTRVVTPELITRWERDLAAPPPYQWWVAEADGATVGFAGIGPSRDPVDPNLGELDTIAVDPVWWRSGVGRALMAVTLRGLAEYGWREAVLWTLAHYERGQRFYTAMGWQLDGGVRNEGRQLRYRYRLTAGL